MCYGLEFDKRTGKARNKLTIARLILNIVGLFIVLALGAVAAAIASYHATWFPQRLGDDGVYWRLSRQRDFSSRARVFTLTNQCENFDDLKKDTLVFQCGKAIDRCIPMDNLCDGIRDCADNSDEEESLCETFCDAAKGRSGLRFTCDVVVGNDTVSRCLNTKQRCDGIVQCTGEEESSNDESACEGTYLRGGKTVCSADNNWVCQDNMQCIRQSDVCNGINNCLDGSDEKELLCA